MLSVSQFLIIMLVTILLLLLLTVQTVGYPGQWIICSTADTKIEKVYHRASQHVKSGRVTPSELRERF